MCVCVCLYVDVFLMLKHHQHASVFIYKLRICWSLLGGVIRPSRPFCSHAPWGYSSSHLHSGTSQAASGSSKAAVCAQVQTATLTDQPTVSALSKPFVYLVFPLAVFQHRLSSRHTHHTEERHRVVAFVHQTKSCKTWTTVVTLWSLGFLWGPWGCWGGKEAASSCQAWALPSPQDGNPWLPSCQLMVSTHCSPTLTSGFLVQPFNRGPQPLVLMLNDLRWSCCNHNRNKGAHCI